MKYEYKIYTYSGKNLWAKGLFDAEKKAKNKFGDAKVGYTGKSKKERKK